MRTKQKPQKPQNPRSRISVAAMPTKQNKPRRIKCEEDRISLLPDCLLIEIISRVPCTKQAFKTGILSKRWKDLWTGVHNLFFIHHSYEQIPELFSFIEKVLRQRGQLNLHKFKLDIFNKNDIDKQVNNWICYAFICNVQDLDLVVDTGGDPRKSLFELDKFFFINSSFTNMKLDGCVYNRTGAISWTNLKSLCIRFENYVTDGKLIENILSGSPLLETLKLQDCQCVNTIDITSKSVKNLIFSGSGDPEDWCDLEYIKINAPHILSLTIEEEFPPSVREIVLLNVSSLVEATLDYSEVEDYFDEPTGKEDRGEMLKGLILSLRHVKKLKIGYKCVETLARLKAKGFTFPSNMKHPKVPAYVSSSESEDCSDNDLSESDD